MSLEVLVVDIEGLLNLLMQRSVITREVDEFLENRPSRDKDEDSQDAADSDKNDEEDELQLVDYFPGAQGCRRVEEFHCLNRIEEGTYGVVYRAKDKLTSEYP